MYSTVCITVDALQTVLASRILSDCLVSIVYVGSLHGDVRLIWQSGWQENETRTGASVYTNTSRTELEKRLLHDFKRAHASSVTCLCMPLKSRHTNSDTCKNAFSPVK